MPVTYALIHQENGQFGISFPDFPGCISGGKNEEEAIRRGTEALNFHVEGMIEEGHAIPMLRNAKELRADPELAEELEDGILTLVSFEMPGKILRINITIDEHLLSAIDKDAKAHNQSRSAYIADAARNKIRGAA
ncbi:type II toxin-antitoxin system HicB family antitoxin [Brucella sp. NBRC 12950]|uniref:type II toxin-antitoxin system HicB family antitoxin n=1 Tax=Brucella sp. NBRC 12950 TaxID=2994518 RepID=UPI00249FB688|nr:type II toxin-antitoxin system HicB family antitoxin [Brucella sp. NBRC 12950]GLU28487.1 HicB family protein [Brucella sp. NBRC 12950]